MIWVLNHPLSRADRQPASHSPAKEVDREEASSAEHTGGTNRDCKGHTRRVKFIFPKLFVCLSVLLIRLRDVKVRLSGGMPVPLSGS